MKEKPEQVALNKPSREAVQLSYKYIIAHILPRLIHQQKKPEQ